MPSPEPWYIASALAIGFAITFTLRALPFAILAPLRESKLVKAMATWMPVGILAILAAATFLSATDAEDRLPHAAIAAAVTIAVHLLGRRRTLLSVGAGTLTYVLLVTIF